MDFHGFTETETSASAFRSRKCKLFIERDLFSLSMPVGTSVPPHLTVDAIEETITLPLKTSEGPTMAFSKKKGNTSKKKVEPPKKKTATLKKKPDNLDKQVENPPKKLEEPTKRLEGPKKKKNRQPAAYKEEEELSKRRSRSATPACTVDAEANKPKTPTPTPPSLYPTPEPIIKCSKKKEKEPSMAKTDPSFSRKAKKRTASSSIGDDIAAAPPKALLRPSKLGNLGSPSSVQSGSNLFSASLSDSSSGPTSSSSTPRLFESSPADLIVEGKRQWKPTAKVQESIDMKKSIAQYANAMASTAKLPSSITGGGSQKSVGGGMDSSSGAAEKIQRILASQWESRLRKVDNKFVKSTTRVPEEGVSYET